MALSKREIQLVLRAQSADREALNELLKCTQDWLFGYLMNLLRDREHALDIVQESFMLIYRKLNWLQDPRAYRSWVYRLASRKAIESLRKRSSTATESLDESVAVMPSATPQQNMDNVESIRTHVDLLSPNLRAVVVLYYLEQQSLKEVASILGLPLGTVKSRVNYALTKLRQGTGRHKE